MSFVSSFERHLDIMGQSAERQPESKSNRETLKQRPLDTASDDELERLLQEQTKRVEDMEILIREKTLDCRMMTWGAGPLKTQRKRINGSFDLYLRSALENTVGQISATSINSVRSPSNQGWDLNSLSLDPEE